MGNAQLAPLTLVGPGFAGLNKQQSSSLLGPEWAIEAKNCIFDDANRLSSRRGWTAVTTSAVSSNHPKQIFEYKGTSSNIVISSCNNKLWSGTTTLTDITGALSVSADNWKFVNFNGLCFGLQTGHALIFYSGSGNFTTVTPSSGTVPTGNELLGAFGRLWGVMADKTTIKWSGLLDGSSWNAGGAGSINLLSVWGEADEIVSLAAFNASLVVFGKRNIVFLGDGTGSTLGINPAQMYVSDIIPGIGCIARDSVRNVNGDDLVFLSYNGVQSLRRVIQEKSNPLRNISANIRDYLVSRLSSESVDNIRSVFMPRDGIYLLIFPTTSNIFCFSTKGELQDGTWRATEWDGFIPKSIAVLEDGLTVYAGVAGKLYSHSGTTDNGSTYRYVYRSGWLSMSEEVMNRIKILKRLSAVAYLSGSTTVTFRWSFDFSNTFSYLSVSSTSPTTGAEWGLGEWGLGEFGGSFGLREFEIPASGSGQFIQIGVEADISGDQFALQQSQIFAKVGRLV